MVGVDVYALWRGRGVTRVEGGGRWQSRSFKTAASARPRSCSPEISDTAVVVAVLRLRGLKAYLLEAGLLRQLPRTHDFEPPQEQRPCSPSLWACVLAVCANSHN